MRVTLILGLVVLVAQRSVAPPVLKKQEEVPVEHSEDETNDLEYGRYLKEVAEVLETDPVFSEKLLSAKEKEIRTGEVAHNLKFVDHKIRTKLDELKRQELERLRHLATKEFEFENGLDPTHLKIAEHIDHVNPHSFEIDDLRKLIIKTTKDLDEVDRKRKEEFKEYEMEKKFEQEQKMKTMNEEERKKFEANLAEMEQKHKNHDPLLHPGSKQQLEEVWEKEDHMEGQDFDPKTFFYLHDIDGNGFLDEVEVKALFRKELDKLYASGTLEDDIRERAEEMERMREHVFKEIDLDRDGLISYYEFQQDVKTPQFKEEKGWRPLDEQDIYSQQEYEAFKQHKEQEIQKLIAQGLLSPQQQDSHLTGYPQQISPQHPNVPIPQGDQHQNFVANQIPHGQQQFQGQPVAQQYYQAQPPQAHVAQQQYPGHVQQQQFQAQPPQQQFQAQPPQQQYQAQPPQQHYQAQPPQQQYQGQIPQQQQQFQGHIPQQQQQQQFQAQVQPQQLNPQGQVPQQVQGHVPQQTQQSQQVPQQVQGQVPQQQQGQVGQVGQVPQQQQGQVGQVPQQQQVQGQVPQYQQPNQAQQPVQNQVPVQQPVPVVGQVAQNSIPNVVKT